MTWTGTKRMEWPAWAKRQRISDSISKWPAAMVRLAQASRCMSRNPFWVSGRWQWARRESWRLIQRLTWRRSHGMPEGLAMRLPTTSRAPVCSAHSRNRREIGGVVLAVTVHGDGPGEPLFVGGGPAAKECGAFALGLVVTEDLGAGGPGEVGGVVR
jgi:hypothetical protein